VTLGLHDLIASTEVLVLACERAAAVQARGSKDERRAHCLRSALTALREAAALDGAGPSSSGSTR
jgi:hypothetical protein